MTADVQGPTHDLPSPQVVELWKRSEQIKFEEYLKSVEADRLNAVKSELTKIKKIEAKLKIKLVELENRERDLSAAEANLKRKQDDLALQLKRQSDDHSNQIKLLSERHAVALKIEKDKLKAEESKRKSLEIELAVKPKNSSRTNELETKLRIKELELERAAEREKALTNDRDHLHTTLRSLVNPPPQVQPQPSRDITVIQQTRAKLLASGIYHEGDEVIAQIDKRITARTCYLNCLCVLALS